MKKREEARYPPPPITIHKLSKRFKNKINLPLDKKDIITKLFISQIPKKYKRSGQNTSLRDRKTCFLLSHFGKFMFQIYNS